ncbi:hypothetical protein [Polaribacter sp.]|uniref:hypothetical protein n=1 Tax=Polaribacter sp. TaxID=1920175 RepID=UPI003EFAF256
MDFLIKIGQIALILVVIYLWNTFIIKKIIQKVIGYHKKYNSNNIDKQPIKFFVDHELNIIKYAQYFYWLGGLLISLGILLN